MYHRTKWPNTQSSPLINELSSNFNSPGQATTKFWKPTITIISDLNSNFQLPKPGDRRNFNTHKTRWECCINDVRPTRKKQNCWMGLWKNRKNNKLILIGTRTVGDLPWHSQQSLWASSQEAKIIYLISENFIDIFNWFCIGNLILK